MKYEFKPSFDRSVKSLIPIDKEDIIKACQALINLLESHGSLSKGLGLKNMRDQYWEIRKGIRLRILFRWREDSVEFILAGSHDHIKNFLKTI